jgi:hypothetical protein
VFDIKKQIGIAVGVIRKYYGHINKREVAARLTGTDFRSDNIERDTAE